MQKISAQTTRQSVVVLKKGRFFSMLQKTQRRNNSISFGFLVFGRPISLKQRLFKQSVFGVCFVHNFKVMNAACMTPSSEDTLTRFCYSFLRSKMSQKIVHMITPEYICIVVSFDIWVGNLIFLASFIVYVVSYFSELLLSLFPILGAIFSHCSKT